MTSDLQQALDIIHGQAASSTEAGTAFEELVKIFLENDAMQTKL